jgi:hypothetical protein
MTHMEQQLWCILTFFNDFRNQNSALLSTTFVPEFSVQINTGKLKKQGNTFRMPITK